MVYISKGKLEQIDGNTITVITPQERIKICGLLKDLWLNGMTKVAEPDTEVEDRILFLQHQGLVEIDQSNDSNLLLLNQYPVPCGDIFDIEYLNGLNNFDSELLKWIYNGLMYLAGYEYVGIFRKTNVPFDDLKRSENFMQYVCSVLYTDTDPSNESQIVSDMLADKNTVTVVDQYGKALSSLLQKRLVYIL